MNNLKRFKKGSGVAMILYQSTVLLFLVILFATAVNQYTYQIQMKQFNRALKVAAEAAVLQFNTDDPVVLEAIAKGWYLPTETVTLLKPDYDKAYKVYDRLLYDNIKHLLFNKSYADFKSKLIILSVEPQYSGGTIVGYRVGELRSTGYLFKTNVSDLKALASYIKTEYGIGIDLIKIYKLATSVEDSKRYDMFTIISLVKDYKLKNIFASQSLNMYDVSSVSLTRVSK